ncbi:DNA (cytosine-5)-methyltransferase 1 [Methylobacterium sp. BE186]|uniref:DNA cytosine methyltransferase n=1 Tax=Methylobacterium sp. BE186 TaxID=2817715 RepID=UPI00285C66F3|nr:DNA cytosine methyltransferase [Methylobacterium sp. BE186]MDR7037376.1 DNA (cytosine-5)-methyltransferase 1 [Methylobacterium sp. BE186]
MTPLRVLDLFSGIGGFSLGLERTGGFKTVAFCEIEPFPRRVLAKPWPEVPCYDDVRTLTADRLRADGIAVDVICGGFPCQDISTAGKHVGIGGERSGLWSEIVRLSGELRPNFIIVENVSALLSCGMGRVLGDLASLGYDAEWDCITADAVGAPHSRDRVWIVAHSRRFAGAFSFPTRRDAAEARRRNAKIWRQNRHFPQVAPVLAQVSAQGMDQPNFDRVVDGVSDWAHRLKGCGNSVVPQIPEMIGHAILASLAEQEVSA